VLKALLVCKTSGRSWFQLVFYSNYRPRSQSAFMTTNHRRHATACFT